MASEEFASVQTKVELAMLNVVSQKANRSAKLKQLVHRNADSALGKQLGGFGTSGRVRAQAEKVVPLLGFVDATMVLMPTTVPFGTLVHGS
jgi:hypothetical protein